MEVMKWCDRIAEIQESFERSGLRIKDPTWPKRDPTWRKSDKVGEKVNLLAKTNLFVAFSLWRWIFDASKARTL